MKTYDLSPTRDKYYRQTNNEIAPGVTCKPTSTVMCLDIAGWPLPIGPRKQPEDSLTELCRSTSGIKKMLEIDRSLNGTMPNEVWGVIAWVVNERWYPDEAVKPIIGPRFDWSLQEALFGITQGFPFAASTKLTEGGHVVAVVGFDTEQEEKPGAVKALDMKKVKSIIIDDPFGDRTSGEYDTAKTGYHNRYDMATWLSIWKSVGIMVRRK